MCLSVGMKKNPVAKRSLSVLSLFPAYTYRYATDLDLYFVRHWFALSLQNSVMFASVSEICMRLLVYVSPLVYALCRGEIDRQCERAFVMSVCVCV